MDEPDEGPRDPVQDESHFCGACGRVFSTSLGLKQHTRKSHQKIRVKGGRKIGRKEKRKSSSPIKSKQISPKSPDPRTPRKFSPSPISVNKTYLLILIKTAPMSSDFWLCFTYKEMSYTF